MEARVNDRFRRLGDQLIVIMISSKLEAVTEGQACASRKLPRLSSVFRCIKASEGYLPWTLLLAPGTHCSLLHFSNEQNSIVPSAVQLEHITAWLLENFRGCEYSHSAWVDVASLVEGWSLFRSFRNV
jgi:hypothetical protein